MAGRRWSSSNDSKMSQLWRLCHWGPLIALAIIKCISFTTLYYTGLWLSFSGSGWPAAINYVIYYSLLASTMYNFLCSIFAGPGYVPPRWRPRDPQNESYLQFCHQCDAFKAPRSHHCSKCGRCILKMDHHCPWINNCCGHRNQRYFFYFLLSAVLGSIHSAILLSVTLYRALTFIPNPNRRYIRLTMTGAFAILISIGMAIGVVLAVGFLLVIQAKILLRNRTTIEDWIIKKAKLRRRHENEQEFVYPYDLGWWSNIRQVLGSSRNDNDGIESWPIKDGCHKYALTYEQLQQKKDKMQNASLYRAIHSYNGRFFPLFSQGCRVCLAFPINDDPRLALVPGDTILVTHSHKHWFYGKMAESNGNGEKLPRKGWFPMRCVAPVVQPITSTSNPPNSNHESSSLSDDENELKKTK